MYEAAATGTPAIRPLFYEFPEEQVQFISNIKKNSYYFYCFVFPEDLRHLRPVHGRRRPPLLPRLGPTSFGHLADTRFLPLWQLARNLHKIRFAQINRKTTA